MTVQHREPSNPNKKQSPDGFNSAARELCFESFNLPFRHTRSLSEQAPTETQNANNKHAFWTSLDRVVEEVPKHEQLFVLMDANARTGRRKKGQVGSKDSKSLGAYGRDTLTTTENYCYPSLTTTT